LYSFDSGVNDARFGVYFVYNGPGAAQLGLRMLIHIALSLSLLGSLALAWMLWRWADRVSGVRPLIGFLGGIAVWIAGNELPTWFGAGVERLGLSLLATAALTSAMFLHFAVAFTHSRAWRLVTAGYAVGIAAMLLSMVVQPGAYEPFAGMDYVAIPNRTGWITSFVWALLAAAGMVVLLRALRVRHGAERRQIGAVMGACAWGLACMSGYAIAALHLPLRPWPLLGLPLYPVLLVYGILRYRLLVANAWARRALAWTILVAIAGLVVAAVPLLPVGDMLGSRLVTAGGVAVSFLVLGGPARRLAARIIYPGGTVTAEDLAAWRATLAAALDNTDLAQLAAAILSRRLSIAVQVQVGEPPAPSAAPLLLCRRSGTGWEASLESGWDAAPPGPRRVVSMLGALVIEEAQRLERAVVLAEQERERQVQSRLAELGALAATVAHDVRNPLNIIGMAVATVDPAIRAEVNGQMRRITRLADDLLDYAKPWSVVPAPLNVARVLRDAAAQRAGTAVAPGLAPDVSVMADADRLGQALANLLDNACAVSSRVMLDAVREGDLVDLQICDDGPGIPEDLRDRIFQPFVSRSPGGTGLGLAIVARIAAAHGGSVTLGERSGWSTCITLRLRAAP
jgi:signal transduction histidine kinase